MAKSASHKVVCVVCGRKGKVAIKSGKIAKTDWNFFGKFKLKSALGEFAFQAAELKSLPVSESVKFQDSDHETVSMPVEYWECANCFKDNESILK